MDKPLPPKDAIAYFRQKELAASFDYRDVWQQEHAKAFTVAKMMDLVLLATTKAAVDKAIAGGQTFEQFKKELKPILQAAGWWGRQEMRDPLTGEVKTVQLGSDRRLRTIFATNTRVAYQVGNWQRSWRLREDFPYLLYHHNDVRYPRPEHVAWDGTILLITDVWWSTHYPPCEWGCKCTTESLSEDMLWERKLKVTPRPASFGKAEYVNPRTGEVSQVEKGINPAWNYNPGQAPLRGLTARPEQVPENRPMKDIGTATAPFFKALGVDPKVGRIVTDRDGWPVTLSDQLFLDGSGKPAVPNSDLSILPDVARTLLKPDTMGWLWASDREVLTIDRVLSGASGTGTLAPINGAVVQALRKEGVEVSGFSHTLDADAWRHIEKKHGSLTGEASRGQIGVTAEDAKSLPGVVAAPDIMIVGGRDDRGMPTIVFIKQRPTDTLIYVTWIRAGKRMVSAKTMWKRPAGTDAKDLAVSLTSYARSGGGNVETIIDLRGQINPPDDVLVRRYTKRIDKSLVTVDFSAGTWTYGSRPFSKP